MPRVRLPPQHFTLEIEMNRIICWLLGHTAYRPNALNNCGLVSLHDALGETLVTIDVCKRCGAVYSDLR